MGAKEEYEARKSRRQAEADAKEKAALEKNATEARQAAEREEVQARKLAENAEVERARSDADADARQWWFRQTNPVDRFTGWLVAWTAFLFIATIANAIILHHTDEKIGKQAEILASQLKAMQDQLIEMRGSGKQTDLLIDASRRSADAAKEAAVAAKQSADAIASLERPYFFLLAKTGGQAVPRTGSFDSMATPAITYQIVNLGRVPGVLRVLYTHCYLHSGDLPEKPIVDGSSFRPAQNPIAAGLTSSDYPPCNFAEPFSPQDWRDIADNKKVPLFMAIVIYEGALDFTYVDTVTYRMDFFQGQAFAIPDPNYNSGHANSGRMTKGATTTIPNILWKATEVPFSQK